MRLTDDHAAAIRDAAHAVFGRDAVVRLFGSRVDARRSGDIDFHVGAATVDIMGITRSRAELWRRIDEEQVDVVVQRRGDPDGWIDRTARRDGIVL